MKPLIVTLIVLVFAAVVSAHTDHDVEQSALGYDVELITTPISPVAGDEVTLRLLISDETGVPVDEDDAEIEIFRERFPLTKIQPGIYEYLFTFERFGHNEFDFHFSERTISMGIDIGVPQGSQNAGATVFLIVILVILIFGGLVFLKKMTWSSAAIYGSISVVVLSLGYSVFAYQQSPAVQGCLLQVGDEFVMHCHQEVFVNICGEEKGFGWEEGSLDSAHTHKGDHRIHWHPGAPVKDPDALMTLRNMFTDLGIMLNEQGVEDPESGTMFHTGDGLCDGEAGNLKVFMTEENSDARVELTNFMDAPLSDEARIDIVFGSEGSELHDHSTHDHEEEAAADDHSDEEHHDDDEHEEHAENLKHGHLDTFGPGEAPHFHSLDLDTVARVDDIARDPSEVPPPIQYSEPRLVKYSITAKEVISEIAPGITYHYWTFDGGVPGPMLRVRVGDTVELTLHNEVASSHTHSIDLHAVTGPGGAATSMQVEAGDSKTIRFKVLNPGTYVYHCATPNVPMHMAHGMYGLIVVEPEEGLPRVDKEFYVMQGELYTKGGIGATGFQEFDAEKMLAEEPDYVVFNGRTKALVDHPLSTNVGDRVRLYVGNGGVSLISSFHVIGEIFDRVYLEASSNILKDVQTTTIPAGGATVVEFAMEVPGTYVLVDHALARLDRGAWGLLTATGPDNPEIYDPVE